MNTDFDGIRKVLIKTAQIAGEFLKKSQSKVSILRYKVTQDIQTTVDIESEKIILKELFEAYPQANILSEETGEINHHSEMTFIIDPLDGTKEYFRQLPLYNISLACEINGQTVASAIFRPAENQLFSAAKGSGAFLNDQKITPSTISDMEKSFVYCYLPTYSRNPEKFSKNWETLGKINRSVYRLRALADENTMCCWTAMGGTEAYINLGNPPKYWDIAPGIFIAQEAGCKITDRYGKPIDLKKIESIIISNGKIHEKLLTLL